jgi:hypothetical protein
MIGAGVTEAGVTEAGVTEAGRTGAGRPRLGARTRQADRGRGPVVIVTPGRADTTRDRADLGETASGSPGPPWAR